jgi:hypothetical protein
VRCDGLVGGVRVRGVRLLFIHHSGYRPLAPGW